MSGDLPARLQRLNKLGRLGLKRGASHIALPPPKPRPTEIPLPDSPLPLQFLAYQFDEHNPAPIESVIPGAVVETEYGPYFSFEARYPLTARHGNRSLGSLLTSSVGDVAVATGDRRWQDLAWSDFLFIDTETTGLDIAAGTVAFLIGVGYVEGDHFVMRQAFMRDFDEELAVLAGLARLFERFEALVSFNGKAFDLPMLHSRLTLARLQPGLLTRSGRDVSASPHFDLLHPARRLWRRRLGACNLGHLETEILGLRRTQADVPSYWIPTLYRTYLVTGDARPLAGIFYHNEVDVVSMAALAGEICRSVAWFQTGAPAAGAEHALDLLSLGLWYKSLGQVEAAEAALRAALDDELGPDGSETALKHLATLLKRAGRAVEAVPLWETLAAVKRGLLAYEELAKFFEWQQSDLEQAEAWTRRGLALLDSGFDDQPRAEERPKWEHRLARLRRKRSAVSIQAKT